jgi:hypothetical protein
VIPATVPDAPTNVTAVRGNPKLVLVSSAVLAAPAVFFELTKAVSRTGKNPTYSWKAKILAIPAIIFVVLVVTKVITFGG